jgi:hypothetical protein
MRSLLRTLYYNQIGPKTSRFVICKEVFMTIPIVFYTVKDFYLLDSLNDKIEMLKASGLIDKWHYNNIKKNFIKTDSTKIPEVLTVQNLKGCFQLLFFGCIFGLVVFMLECLLKKCCLKVELEADVC